MSVSTYNFQLTAAVALNLIFFPSKVKADLYLVPNSSIETFQWNDSFTVRDVSSFCFEVPDPTFKVLSPVGFRVTYTGKPYYKQILFCCFINKDFPPFMPGKFSKGEISWEILPDKDGRYIYENPFYKLKERDVIYYWTRVTLVDKRWFFKMHQNYTITKETLE